VGDAAQRPATSSAWAARGGFKIGMVDSFYQ